MKKRVALREFAELLKKGGDYQWQTYGKNWGDWRLAAYFSLERS